jgi:hypothetical protein
VPDPAFLLAAAALTALSPAAARQAAPSGAAIRAEFRVFDGTTEITTITRLRVRPSGSTETGTVVESGSDLALDLKAGIYDVQAIRQDSGNVVSVRWAERLVIMAYPDEAGRHLEVINFSGQFGALQLRWPGNHEIDAGAVTVTVAKAGDAHPTPTRPLRGPGYLLLVLPAGTYDIRVAQPGRPDVALGALEVPADRTRMKLIQ